MTELAMFPLGSTVFPHQVVPLHIFEERYRTMIEALTADGATPEFGIVLIDRGHEVGGGDHRVAVGTKMRILQAEQFEDGRWGLISAGVERVNVVEWLSDDPYPRAIVEDRIVVDNGGSDLEDLQRDLLQTIGLLAEAEGVELPAEFEFADDVRVRLDQLCAVSPLTEFDRQAVLEADTTSDQIRLLSEALETKRMLLRAQLGRGDELG